MINIQNEINDENVDEHNFDNISLEDISDPWLQEPENEVITNLDQIIANNSNNEIHTTTHDITMLRRSNHVRRRTWKIRDNMERELKSYSAYYYALHEEYYNIQEIMMDPIAFLAKMDEDTTYYDQTMTEEDAIQFRSAIIKVIKDHCNQKYWTIVKRSDVPPNCDILPSVWSMKRKRDLITRKPIKYKARLNIHGGRQEYGVNYYDTFSPVISWTILRLLFILSSIESWATYQIDYVLAFPQVPIEFDMYMELPRGKEKDAEDHEKNKYVLKLL